MSELLAKEVERVSFMEQDLKRPLSLTDEDLRSDGADFKT